MIRTTEDVIAEAAPEWIGSAAPAELYVRRFWPYSAPLSLLPDGLTPVRSAPLVDAIVVAGAWVGVCPRCGAGAMVVSKLDPRFFCFTCLEDWLTVRFPKDADRIEALLACRRKPEWRNWLPGDNLARENAEHPERLVR